MNRSCHIGRTLPSLISRGIGCEVHKFRRKRALFRGSSTEKLKKVKGPHVASQNRPPIDRRQSSAQFEGQKTGLPSSRDPTNLLEVDVARVTELDAHTADGYPNLKYYTSENKDSS